jgi:hypothetical protein
MTVQTRRNSFPKSALQLLALSTIRAMSSAMSAKARPDIAAFESNFRL